MKLTKLLFASVFLLGSTFSTTILAEEHVNTTQPVVAETQQTVVENKATTDLVVSDKLNINTATASEIQKALIGIGAKKAEAIVQYREKHGNFTAAEQLLEVQGIGKATLEKNKDRIQF